MTKQSPFNRWVEKVRKEWKHVPSLKGKQARRHLAIIKILASKGEASTWEIAKEYLDLKGQWRKWKELEQYQERMKMNSTIYRRLKFMEQKNYVSKTGPKYELTPKGFILALALVPRTVFSDYVKRKDINKVSGKAAKIMSGLFGVPVKSESVGSLAHSLKYTIGKIPLQSKTISFIMREMLLKWKINLDEISEEDLLNLWFKEMRDLGSIAFPT